MKKLVVFSMVCVAMVACSLPDVQDINLSGCNEQCNTDSRVCFANVNDAGAQCLDLANSDPDASFSQQEAKYQACGETQTKAGEDCVNTLVSCIDKCIAQTEADLKK